MCIVEKHADGANTSVQFFWLAVLFFASGHANTVIFCILLWKLDEWTPCKLKGLSNMHLMIFHAFLRKISKCYFRAISLRELSVCAFFRLFQLWSYALRWFFELEGFNIHTTGQPGLSNVTNIFNNPAHKARVWAQAHTLTKYVETQNPKRFLVVADCIKNIMRMCKRCLPPPVWSFPDFEDEILPKPCWDGGNTMCQMIFFGILPGSSQRNLAYCPN